MLGVLECILPSATTEIHFEANRTKTDSIQGAGLLTSGTADLIESQLIPV